MAQATLPAGLPNAPVIVLSNTTTREEGRKAQLGNITAAKTVADIIRTCLGPRAMLKMLMDPMGGIVITNDGNAILREIDVSHPAAKSMIDLSRALDEEVGDGTTSVIILAAELLATSAIFIERKIHPTHIVSAYLKVLEEAGKIAKGLCKPLDTNDRMAVVNVIKSCIGTKFSSRWDKLLCDLAFDAVRTVTIKRDDGTYEIDIKRYAKVEKIPGGEITDCVVLDGVMFNKDIIHSKMRRRIENPRILLLDCPLEYKKGESQTNIEVKGDTDFTRLLQIEEETIKRMCDEIIAVKPDVVVTEKGFSDLAQHYLVKAGITGIRRLRKTDNLRIARAAGATICHRTDEIKESDIGTKAGLFEIKLVGDEYFTFITKCEDPKACTILLRGGSKDVLNEVERNLHDALNVTRNVFHEPLLVPGGGAFEMAISEALIEKSKSIEGIEQWPFKNAGEVLSVIPRTLAQNCGANVVRLLTELRAKHAADKTCTWGINGITGQLCDIAELGIWEPYVVKMQTLKTAIEAACVLLRIDEVVSGIQRKPDPSQQQGGQPQMDQEQMAEMAEAQGQ